MFALQPFNRLRIFAKKLHVIKDNLSQSLCLQSHRYFVKLMFNSVKCTNQGALERNVSTIFKFSEFLSQKPVLLKILHVA